MTRVSLKRAKKGAEMGTLRELAKLDAYDELARIVAKGNFEVDDSGFTSMHAAACIGDVASIDRFARHGADPDVDDGWGWTPLIEATKRGHLTAVVRLLELGASARPHSVQAPPGFVVCREPRLHHGDDKIGALP